MSHESQRRDHPMVLPDEEGQAGDDGAQPAGGEAAGRRRVAVYRPVALEDQPPAEREEVQLIAGNLAARHHGDREREADEKDQADPAPVVEPHHCRASPARRPRRSGNESSAAARSRSERRLCTGRKSSTNGKTAAIPSTSGWYSGCPRWGLSQISR